MSLRKIYLVSPHIPPRYSGSGNFTLQQARYFSDQGYDVDLLTLTPAASDRRQLRIRVVDSAYESASSNRLLANARLLGRLYSAIDDNEGAVLHCMSPATWFGLLSVLAARLRGVPASFEPNLLGANDLETIARSKLGSFKARVLTKADAEVCMSPALALLSQKAGMVPDKQHKIPNPVDTSRFSPVSEERKRELRHELGTDRHRHMLVFVGAIRERKGVRRLLESFAAVRARRDDCAFYLVGPTEKDEKNKAYTEAMRALIAELGLEDSAFLVGRVSNAEEWMQASDVYVFGSRAEGLPSVLLEASSTGLPVVTYSMPGITDYVFEDGENGYIVNETSEFVARVETLLDDPELRKHVGELAREHALLRFDERVVLNEYLNLFERMVRETR